MVLTDGIGSEVGRPTAELGRRRCGGLNGLHGDPTNDGRPLNWSDGDDTGSWRRPMTLAVLDLDLDGLAWPAQLMM